MYKFASFLHRRNGEARKKWPGTTVVKFKGSKETDDDLQNLIDKLVPIYSFPEAGFGPRAIRQHIIDCLNERRRRKRNGYNFELGVMYTVAEHKISR